MSFKPLNDRVLVKRLESEEKTAGGLFIPDTAKEKPSRGEVVAVGPGKCDESGKRIAMSVKAGDNVLFNKYAGTEIKLDGVEHLVMREDDILGYHRLNYTNFEEIISCPPKKYCLIPKLVTAWLWAWTSWPTP